MGGAPVYDAGDMLRPFKRKWTPNYFKNHIEEFSKIYDLLYDDISKDTMYEYLKTYFTGKRYSGKTYPEEYKYWGIEDDTHKIFNIKKGVILNIGAYVGDTVALFIKTNIEFEKIIAIEADTEILNKLKMNLNCLPEKYKEKVQIDNYFIGEGNSDLKEKSIDELYCNNNIALINMDIEGAELSALKSGIETIKKSRPILSVCAYHKRDDLIELPKFVMENFDDYAFVLRKYPSMYFYGFDGVQQINELVLYAVPKEQLV